MRGLDARPKVVKGIIAIEPAGPPFEATIIGTGKARAWGPTDIPITYDSLINNPHEGAPGVAVAMLSPGIAPGGPGVPLGPLCHWVLGAARLVAPHCDRRHEMSDLAADCEPSHIATRMSCASVAALATDPALH